MFSARRSLVIFTGGPLLPGPVLRPTWTERELLAVMPRPSSTVTLASQFPLVAYTCVGLGLFECVEPSPKSQS